MQKHIRPSLALLVLLSLCSVRVGVAQQQEGFGTSKRRMTDGQIPELVDPKQFKIPKIRSIQDKAPETSAFKRISTRLPGQEKQDGMALDSLPEPSLNQGIRANTMQRATFNRTYDPNLTFMANAYPHSEKRIESGQILHKTWRTPNFANNPLYFEDENLERYGNGHGILQPLYSGAHFFTSVALLPCKTGVNSPDECVYSMGYFRPGNCNPAYRNRIEMSRKGLLREAIAVGGIAAVLF